MILEVDGVQYQNFTHARVELRLDALCNSFTFDVNESDETLPFNTGQSVKVFVDGEQVLSGYIEVITGTADNSSHNLTIRGRDKTGDFLDSTIRELDDLRTSTSLKRIIEQIVKHYGLDIQVIDNANPRRFNSAEDIASPEPGENGFSFVESLARKRQVLLTSDSDGNIVIEKTPGDDTGITLQNLKNDNSNNIISSSWTNDATGLYNTYAFKSWLNLTALNNANTTKPDTVINQSGAVLDTSIRSGRQFSLLAEQMASDSELKKRAEWEARIRKARGKIYSCMVQGHRQSTALGAALWDTNRLVTVIDTFAKLNQKMLINQVTFEFNDSGRTTTLGLIEPSAYSLEISEPTIESE